MAILGILVLSSVAATSAGVVIPRSYAASSTTLYPDALAGNELCGGNPSAYPLDTSVPSAGSTTLSFPAGSTDFCTSNFPTPVPVQYIKIVLYYASSTPANVLVTVTDESNGQMLSGSGSSSSTATSCTSPAKVTIGLTGSSISPLPFEQGNIVTVEIYNLGGSALTLCTGSAVQGNPASYITFSNTTLPTPVFPIGTLVALLVPLAALGIYFAFKKRSRPEFSSPNTISLQIRK